MPGLRPHSGATPGCMTPPPDLAPPPDGVSAHSRPSPQAPQPRPSHPLSSPAPGCLAPPPYAWPRPAHHVAFSLQTGQVRAAGAQVWGGRVSAPGGLRPVRPRRCFLLRDGLRLGALAGRGRLCWADHGADRRAALQGRGLGGGRGAALQLLLRGPARKKGKLRLGLLRLGGGKIWGLKQTQWVKPRLRAVGRIPRYWRGQGKRLFRGGGGGTG